MSSPYTILLTVGTTKFPTLTSLFLSPHNLISLPQHFGDSINVILQYGGEHFESVKEKVDKGIKESGYGGRWGEGEVVLKKGSVTITINFHPYLNPLPYSTSSLIITHAGAGTLLEVLPLHNKNILIVPNRELMDDHQLEIAEVLKEKVAVYEGGEIDWSILKAGKNGGEGKGGEVFGRIFWEEVEKSRKGGIECIII